MQYYFIQKPSNKYLFLAKKLENNKKVFQTKCNLIFKITLVNGHFHGDKFLSLVSTFKNIIEKLCQNVEKYENFIQLHKSLALLCSTKETLLKEVRISAKSAEV